MKQQLVMSMLDGYGNYAEGNKMGLSLLMLGIVVVVSLLMGPDIDREESSDDLD